MAEDDSTQSATVLQALLQESQEDRSKAAASLRTRAARNEQLLAELSSNIGLSVFEAELSAHASVQSRLATEQTVGTRLRNKNS